MVDVSGLRMLGGVTSSMAPQLEITFEPTILITTGRINKMGLNFRSFKEPLTKSIKQVMTDSIRTNFEVGGRPAWAPLSAATLAIRAYWGEGGSSPLINTGALMEQASSFNIWTITQTFAAIERLPGSVWYGVIHQAGYGGRGTSSKASWQERINAQQRLLRGMDRAGQQPDVVQPIPARPFVMFQPEDEDRIVEIFSEWMEKKIAEAWPAGR